jgi:hypothetical protein
MALRLIVLVLDGFSVRHCTPAIAPNLVRAGEQGAWAPSGGRAVLASATYPNHASLLTGLEPAAHGIFANDTFTATGVRAAAEIGARGTTWLDAARAAGLRTAAVAGDPKILGVVGAARCETQWPADARVPAGVELVRGYPINTLPFQALLGVLEQGADAVLCQLDNTDGISHLFGPDSPEALAAHRDADELVGRLLDGLRRDARWRETIVAVVSDHSQRATDPDQPPLDVPGALARAGVEGEVIEEGSGVLVRAREPAAARDVVAALPGVAGVQAYLPGLLYAHAAAGRAFATRKPLPRGIHGCPDTIATLCVVAGGHPGIAALRVALAADPPTSATLPRLLVRAVGLDWEPGRGSDTGGA